MRRSSVLIALPALLLAASCGDGEADEATPNPEPFVEIVREAVLTEDAYYLEGEAGVTDLRVDGANLVFTAEAAPAGLEPGVVVLGAADGGYVRRVVAVELVDGVVTVQTEIASPADFFEDLAVRFRPELVAAQALTAEGVGASGRAISTSVGLSWSGEQTCFQGGVEVGDAQLPSVDFSLDVAPIFELDIVDGDFVSSVGLKGSASAAIELDGTLQGSLRCVLEIEETLNSYPFTVPIPTPVAIILVPMTLDVGPHSFGEISISGEADFSMSAHAGGELVLALDHGWGGDFSVRDDGTTYEVGLDLDVAEGAYDVSVSYGAGVKFELLVLGTVGPTLELALANDHSVSESQVTCMRSESVETSLIVEAGVEAELPLVPGCPDASATVSESWTLATEGPDETPLPACTPVSGLVAKLSERFECADLDPYMQGFMTTRIEYPQSGRVEESSTSAWFAVEPPACFGANQYQLAPTFGDGTFTMRWHKELNDWVEDWTVVATLAPDEQSLARVQMDYTGTLHYENPQHITAQLVVKNLPLRTDNERVVAFEGRLADGLEIETMRYRRTEQRYVTTPTGPELFTDTLEVIDACNEGFANAKFGLDVRLAGR